MEGFGKIRRSLWNSIRTFDWSRFDPRRMEKRRLLLALRAMFRPLGAFNDIKWENKGSLLLANVICVLTFVVSFLEYALKGFIFNYQASEPFDVFAALLTSSLLLFLWALANWGVCSLLDGEATFAQVWITTCYAMLPRVIFALPMIGISNLFTLDEQSLYQSLNGVLYIWCGLLLVLGMLVMHQYTVKKTIASIFLTLAGIVIILFVAVLFISMFQQFVAFIETVVQEIRYRL